MASPMDLERCNHGMGVFKINGEDRLAVFGGFDGDHIIWSDCVVEIYNTQTGKWEMTDFKLREAKFGFGFLAIKLGDILSKL